MNPYCTAVFAHLFGLLALILLLVWILHYRNGFDYHSTDPYRVFNVHPLMMYFGFIFFIGQAILAYNTVPGQRQTQKVIHLTLHLIGIILGVVGIAAVFKFHDMMKQDDVYTLHSWIGLGTFCLFGVQWLFGLAVMLRGSRQSRVTATPWHIAAGRALFFMAICAALTGLMEKHTELGGVKLQIKESYLINFTGLAILLFGVFVDMSVGLYLQS